ncbi:hypothetical protein DUNSADRAFT_1204 [Dunaliella salina]|uniref:Secreted protein n=1 Tax=Dunaliella salina TaxID=3046 RepID=A0ABQ7GXC9_DUNSA|nr:hypothetical protein DUNSADRAFT_1204 [Dunaliella salina]|eukprot:KAF5839260.1 hypothetical protein DUNSADRAFT_1204 [Dunaliella salina]
MLLTLPPLLSANLGHRHHQIGQDLISWRLLEKDLILETHHILGLHLLPPLLPQPLCLVQLVALQQPVHVLQLALVDLHTKVFVTSVDVLQRVFTL